MSASDRVEGVEWMQDTTMALNAPLAPYQAAIALTPYPDLHTHVTALAQKGLLIVIDEPINKDTEMHSLVRSRKPWHGYDLGVGPKNLDRQAAMATRSEYFDFENELALGRRKDVAMSYPVLRQNDD